MNENPTNNHFVIIGLGNIGQQYAGTRHNIGFDVVDTLAQRHNWQFTPSKGDFYQASNSYSEQSNLLSFKWLQRLLGGADDKSDVTTAPTSGILIKPTTLMNLSGKAAKQALETYHITPQQLIIVVDDFHLPLGRLRFRKNGSHGGHNGLRSLIEELETEDFPRLRVGIGPKPANDEIIRFVLGHFDESSQSLKQSAVERAADACDLILSLPLDNPLDIIATKYNIGSSDPAPGSNGEKS